MHCASPATASSAYIIYIYVYHEINGGKGFVLENNK